MRERLHIPIPILVEGKYDKIHLSQLVDATILTTEGFGVFTSRERQAFLRRVCEERGILLLTDPDGGGRQIRAFLLGILSRERVQQLYVPRREGKERRKRRPSRSGVLGVEGTEPELLFALLRPFADGEPARPPLEPISTARLYLDGLSGTDGASVRRGQLCERLGLPHDLSAKAFVEAVGLLVGREAYEQALASLDVFDKEDE